MVKVPNMPTVVPAPDPTAATMHWRWPWDGPTECGINGRALSTVSTDQITCLACLHELDIHVDDRTQEQKQRDFDRTVWNMWNGR